ncbi:MAG: 5-formyltetrahydrofolate cyclo-ligase [Acidobacteriota bacterium]
MCEASAKRKLRQWALEQRRSLATSEILGMSERIVNNLKEVGEFRRGRRVFVCLSFDNEVSTWKLVEELASDSERRLYVPRVDHDGVMHVHPYPCKLMSLRMGLQQPAPGEPEIPVEDAGSSIDVAIIVGLAFGRQRGYRLGHGNGYFDRFLAGKPLFTIGLSFEFLLVDRLPVELHDIPMRMIVTEDQTYRYGYKHEADIRGTVAE